MRTACYVGTSPGCVLFRNGYRYTQPRLIRTRDDSLHVPEGFKEWQCVEDDL